MRLAQLIAALLAAWWLLPIEGHSQTVAAVVYCDEGSLPRVLSILCRNKDLVELGPNIDKLTAVLEGTLTGGENEALIDTAQTFILTRNGCNAPNENVVTACLQRVLAQRSRGLETALEDPTSIYSEISAYELVRPPFVEKYARFLDGQRLRIQGCFILDPAASPEQRLTGSIREECRDLESDAAMVRVLFDQMNDVRPNFFDRMPRSTWRGDLEIRDGEPVLLMKLEEL